MYQQRRPNLDGRKWLRAIPLDPIAARKQKAEAEAAAAAEEAKQREIEAVAKAREATATEATSESKTATASGAATDGDQVPKLPPATTPAQKTQREIMHECLVEIAEDAELITGKKERSDKDPLTDAQYVFAVDFATPEQATQFNYGKNWLEILAFGKSEGDTELRNYFFPWPGKLMTYSAEVPRVTLMFAGNEKKLSDTLSPELQNMGTKSITGLQMLMPFDTMKAALPGMQRAQLKHAGHLIPVAADLVEFSTEQLPFWSSAALMTFATNDEKETKVVVHSHGHSKVITPSGVTSGLMLPPRTDSSEFKLPETKRGKRRRELFRANFDLLFDPWMSRIGLLNLDVFKTQVMEYQHAEVPGLISVLGPTLSGRELSPVAWWILTFFRYFQTAMYHWHDRQSDATKEKVDCTVYVREDDKVDDTARIRLNVPAAAYMDLLEYFHVKYHPVNYVSRLTRGLGLVFQNTNSDKANEMLRDQIARTGHDPVLDQEFAVVDLEYIPVYGLRTDGEIDEMERPRDKYLDASGVNGRACMCSQAKKTPPLGEASSSMSAPAAAAAAAVEVGVPGIDGRGQLYHHGERHKEPEIRTGSKLHIHY